MSDVKTALEAAEAARIEARAAAVARLAELDAERHELKTLLGRVRTRKNGAAKTPRARKPKPEAVAAV